MSAFPLSAAPRRILIAAGAVVIACAAVSGSVAAAASSGAARPDAASPQSHQLPRPVPVTVSPATTAYLVLDLTTAVCAPNPSCVASLPAAAALLAKARAAGAAVVYSQTPAAGSEILPPVAPEPSDPVVIARADKFFNTALDQILSSRGIQTLVVVGSATNGAVLYTTFEAMLRGYTVVIAEDGTSADSRYIQDYSLFQLLNQPGFANADNTPLQPDAVTLSKSSLVTFAAG